MKTKHKFISLAASVLFLFNASCATINNYDVTNYGYSINPTNYPTQEQQEDFTNILKKHFFESNLKSYEEFLAAVNSCGKRGKDDINGYLTMHSNPNNK